MAILLYDHFIVFNLIYFSMSTCMPFFLKTALLKCKWHYHKQHIFDMRDWTDFSTHTLLQSRVDTVLGRLLRVSWRVFLLSLPHS